MNAWFRLAPPRFLLSRSLIVDLKNCAQTIEHWRYEATGLFICSFINIYLSRFHISICFVNLEHQILD
jgi:hypothetical protein